MYLTDASRFLISCVIQHYAPVVGWGGGGTDAFASLVPFKEVLRREIQGLKVYPVDRS